LTPCGTRMPLKSPRAVSTPECGWFSRGIEHTSHARSGLCDASNRLFGCLRQLPKQKLTQEARCLKRRLAVCLWPQFGSVSDRFGNRTVGSTRPDPVLRRQRSSFGICLGLFDTCPRGTKARRMPQA
jgi:hypothetical protein